MNTQKIDCQERIQQTHGLIGDFDSEFANPSSQYLGNQQPWNMGIRMQPQMEGGTQQQSFGPAKPSSTIIDRFESPASAFYATERYMGFPQYECQVGNPTCGSQYSGSNDSQFSSYQSSGENFESVEQAEPNFELRNSLQSIVKTQFCGNQFYRSSEKSNKIPCSNFPGSKLPLHEQNKLLGDNGSPVGGHFSIPNVENQDHRASYNSYSSPLAQMRFSSRQEKQSPRFSPGGVSVSPGNPISPGPILSSKTRIRWNQDLHEKFVECINRLGGAEKATPKAILKLMDSDGLTIFHVKSHLQKYRIAKYMPDSTEGKAEKRTSINYVPQTDEKNGLHIREALQLQLDVQRSLHEQLEIQRNLQLRIEEQGRQLKMMFDQQQQNTNSLLQSHQNLDITPHDDQPFSIEDVEVSIAEGSDNTHFPSKIS